MLMKLMAMGSQISRAQYRQLRIKAERLRKKGYSYKEIKQKVVVSKSRLSKWCGHIPLTLSQLARLGSLYDRQLRGAKANHLKSLNSKKSVRQAAIKEAAVLPKIALKVSGALLYWAEGNKTGGTALSNSDPVLVVFFVKWLESVFGILPGQLTGHLHLHKGQAEYKEKMYWSKLTRIPLKNFYKTFYKPPGTGHRKNILHHGTIRVRVRGHNPELLRHRILGLAEAVAKYFVPKDVINIQYSQRMGR